MYSLEVKDITLQHLQAVRDKISSLKKLERTLHRMTGSCKPGEQLCPIL
jgi:hypothetical protein